MILYADHRWLNPDVVGRALPDRDPTSGGLQHPTAAKAARSDGKTERIPVVREATRVV